ncbi:MAG TPA: hypothetical protein VMT61_00170 [Candidatus Binataceae bacterium]|nr:hypothetical protein [Candidatus Binataceae bacterium]
MSYTIATFIGALAILVASLTGALTTAWVQHRFWKHQQRQRTRLLVADKITQFYADLLLNWNRERSSVDATRKQEAAWRRESDMQLLAALATQLANVFSPEAVDDYYSLDAALRKVSEMPPEGSSVRAAAAKLIGDLYAEALE